MFWRGWSNYKRQQVVNGLLAAWFLIATWRMWAANDGLWTLIFLAAAVVTVVGALWRSRQNRRGVYDVKRSNGPAV
jgi:hypothetical protein